jgi:hypothetical protein
MSPPSDFLLLQPQAQASAMQAIAVFTLRIFMARPRAAHVGAKRCTYDL